MNKYCAMVVERNEEDRPVSWVYVGLTRDSFSEALEDAVAHAHPWAEVVELVPGLGVLTPQFA